MGRDNDVDVKITDFGLAKRANKEGLKTFCGTPQYFAPEVLKRRNTVLGVGRYGKEADMWSVGERREEEVCSASAGGEVLVCWCRCLWVGEWAVIVLWALGFVNCVRFQASKFE